MPAKRFFVILIIIQLIILSLINKISIINNQNNIFGELITINENILHPQSFEFYTEKEEILQSLESSGKNIKIFEDTNQIVTDADTANWGIETETVEVLNLWDDQLCSIQYMIEFDSENKDTYCDRVWEDALSFFPSEMMYSITKGINSSEIAQWQDQKGNLVSIYLAPKQSQGKECIIIQIMAGRI